MDSSEFVFLLGGVHEGSIYPGSPSAWMGWRHALGENDIIDFSVLVFRSVR